MSDNKPVPPVPEGILSDELLQKINGGECTPNDWIDMLSRARDAYDGIVDFTSYVIERVVISSTTP